MNKLSYSQSMAVPYVILSEIFGCTSISIDGDGGVLFAVPK